MPGEISELLVKWQGGDSSALETLTPFIYEELRKLGRSHLGRHPATPVLQPTALVHEAWIKLASKHDAPLRCRGQFFALASRMMRDILVDHVRRQRAAKRGGSQIAISLEEVSVGEQTRVLEFLVLDDALNRLTGINPRCVQIIEMRFFGGLSIQEVSDALHVSSATIDREWNFARLWLIRELDPQRREERSKTT